MTDYELTCIMAALLMRPAYTGAAATVDEALKIQAEARRQMLKCPPREGEQR